MFKLKLHWQILTALVLGVLVGTIVQASQGAGVKDSPIVNFMEFIGSTVFIGLLKMVIVPLIFSSIVAGIAGRDKTKGFGRLGLKTLAYYLSSSAVAIIIGLSIVNMMKPGLVDGSPNPDLVKFMEDNAEEFKKKGTSVEQSAVGVDNDQNIFSVIGSLIERMIPSNVIHAASDNGSMLSLIFVSLITAFGLLALEGSAKQQLVGLIKGLNELMIKITGFIMKLAPIGVFGLMGWTISQTGPAFLFSMGKYVLTVIIALGIHFVIVLPCLLFLIGKVNPLGKGRPPKK